VLMNTPFNALSAFLVHEYCNFGGRTENMKCVFDNVIDIIFKSIFYLK
jgi:hypothetical protein